MTWNLLSVLAGVVAQGCHAEVTTCLVVGTFQLPGFVCTARNEISLFL